MKYWKEWKNFDENAHEITKDEARRLLKGHWKDEYLADIFDNNRAFQLWTPFYNIYTVDEEGRVPIPDYETLRHYRKEIEAMTPIGDTEEKRQGMRFPYIYAGTYVGMRYAGIDNGWIDFVVIVPKGCEDADKVNRVMDEFWDGEYETYGEAIEDAFPEAIILFHDDEDESEEYEEKWEEFLKSIDWFWVNR